MIDKMLYSLLNLGQDIWVIAVTGGPGGGKSTGLARLNRMLSDRGFKVLISAESATKLIGTGMLPGELPWIDFQEEIFKDTLSQLDRTLSIARRYRDNGWKVIVLCDRGTMDGEAYIGAEKFLGMITRFGYTYKEVCDELYHAAIHMRTAALGAEPFYTLANNKARTESLEEAKALDERTLQAWTRHRQPRVIDNSTGFEDKIARLFAEVCRIVGDPVPLQKQSKFLIKPLELDKIPVKWVDSTITQDYIDSPADNEERRVRSRADDGGKTFYYTIKRQISPGVRVIEEKIVSPTEYKSLRMLCDPSRETIKKRRISFFWKEQFFKIDIFVAPQAGLRLMEVEQTEQSPELKLPPFIEVIRNVTSEKKFLNSEIAWPRQTCGCSGG